MEKQTIKRCGQAFKQDDWQEKRREDGMADGGAARPLALWMTHQLGVDQLS